MTTPQTELIPWSIGAKSGRVYHIVYAPPEDPNAPTASGHAAREVAETEGPICGYKAAYWYTPRTLDDRRKSHGDHCNRCLQRYRQREGKATRTEGADARTND